MREPVRHYPYIRRVGAPLEEVLLVPFAVGGRPVGTVWVIDHDGSQRFNANHARIVANLANFAAAAVTLNESVRRLAAMGTRLDTLSEQVRAALKASRTRPPMG